MRRKLLALALPFALCGCPAFAALLAGATAAAPVVASALDAYAAAARQIAGPAASPEDVAALAALFADQARCAGKVTAALPVADAGPPAPTDAKLVLAALRESIAATQALEAAVARAAPAPLPASVLPFADAGSGEGGQR